MCHRIRAAIAPCSTEVSAFAGKKCKLLYALQGCGRLIGNGDRATAGGLP
jgi:hypothetical protein